MSANMPATPRALERNHQTLRCFPNFQQPQDLTPYVALNTFTDEEIRSPITRWSRPRY
jgi:hypothetical protein